MRFFFTLLMIENRAADGWIGSWSPGIGDPTIAGWVTVFAYFVAAHQCWRAYRRIPAEPRSRFRGGGKTLLPLVLSPFVSRRRLLAIPERDRMASLWLGMSALLVALGFNKQLDLQSALTEIGRKMAFAEGWYGTRRRVQVAFILAVLLAAAWALRSLLNLAAGNVRKLRAVLAGTVFILAFVTIRAASFHHVDRLIGLRLGSFKLNWIIEIGGIAFVALGARRATRLPMPTEVCQAVPVSPNVGPPRRRRR